jgi:tetratricopeptide (TPR) repeat protein
MPQKINSNEFVFTFREIWESTDRRFCFVLGAGASKSSGIRTGNELAATWLDEIQKRMNGQEQEFRNFINDRKIDIGNPGSNYPEIYKERFKIDISSGFDYINKEMELARPSYGYSVLAQILAEKHHNTVVTTNFDNLTEEALYTYSSKRPLVCGHESLAMFAKPSLNRPLIVKIHRDRFLMPQSQPDEIERINEAWVDSLNYIFQISIPVFIGYGGNDGSLMGYLEKIGKFDNLFWCERRGVNISTRVTNLLEKHDGKLIEIEGFDEIMFLLQDGLRLELLGTKIIKIAEERAKKYQDAIIAIKQSQSKSPNKDAQDAAERLVEKVGSNNWLAWELQAQAAKSNDEKDKIYKNGLTELPNNAELNGNYAFFLQIKLRDNKKAEEYFIKALEYDPNNFINLSNYGNLVKLFHKDYDKAESLFKKSYELNPYYTNNIGEYAMFLSDIRKNYDEAEKYHRKLIELDPYNPNYQGNYALFFLYGTKDYSKAKIQFIKALELDPNHAQNNCNYGLFFVESNKDYDNAEKYYKISIHSDPNNAVINMIYATFLKDIRRDYDNAAKYYEKSIEIDPDDVNNIANYVGFLLVSEQSNKYEKYLKFALDNNSDDTIMAELQFYSYAHVKENRDEALAKLKILLCKGIRSPNFNLQDNVEKAIDDNHPDAELLQRLADILTKDIPIGDLCNENKL